MKRIYFYLLLIFTLAFVSCNESWDNHYTEHEQIVINNDISVRDENILTYLEANSELSSYFELMTKYGVTNMLSEHNQSYTLFAYPNQVMAKTTIDSDTSYFVNTCYVDIEIIPSKLYAGQVIQVGTGKYIKVGADESNDLLFYRSKVNKIVKLNDGVVYILDSPINSPRSLYEFFNGLGEEYSLFKSMVQAYEERVPDYGASTPVGIDQTGNTVYDTVYIVKNALLDRYTSTSNTSYSWTMRQENSNSTMLIPNNVVLQKAIDEAFENIKSSLRRTPHSKDSLKVREWIIKALFYDQVLEPHDLAENSNYDLYSVGGYIEEASSAEKPCQWRPSVQIVDVANQIEFSNGKGYYVTKLKVPNNILLWRFKERFYVWRNCTEEERERYFQYDGYENTLIRGSTITNGGWSDEYAPLISYDYMRLYVTAEANEQSPSLEASYPCSFTFTCIGMDDAGNVERILVPPGEYTLSYGFQGLRNSYTVDFYYNDKLVGENLDTNSNWDRYGPALYPEYFYPNDYPGHGSGPSNYDKDGYTAGVLTVEGEGLQEVKITMKSKNAGFYNSWVHPYHWCLRPTENNY